MRLMSKDTNAVIAALAAASFDVPSISASCTNERYNSMYAGLPDVLASVKPILQKHGLWASYGTRRWGSRFRIEQRFHHLPSGQHYGTEVTFDLQSGAPHEIASLMTYGRRYLLQLALNLSSDDDDDGNAAQQDGRAAAGSKPSTTMAEYEATSLRSTAPVQGLPPSSTAIAPTPSESTGFQTPSTPPTHGPVTPLHEGASPETYQPPVPAPMSVMPSTTVHESEPSSPSHSSMSGKPRINPDRVQRGQQLASLYARFRQLVGKEKAESVLQDLVGTTYVRFVTPEKYDTVIHALSDRLSLKPAA
jgi:hypothetical protein